MYLNRKNLILIVACAALIWSCSKKIVDTRFPGTIIPSQKQFSWSMPATREPLKTLYISCGHLIFEYRDQIILFDPFFSTSDLISRTTATTKEALEKYKSVLAEQQVDLKKTKSVWIAHSHYDHAQDLPALVQERMIPSATPVYGGEDGKIQFHNFLSDMDYKVIPNSEVFDQVNPNTFKPIPGSPNVVVYPIRSDHAPHYKLFGFIPIHLMKGSVKRGYFENNFKHYTDRTKRGKWKEGNTYSYVVDFMDGSSIGHRIFIQTSASHYPLGRPYLEFLKQRPVDLAFLCAASSNYVKRNYPQRILEDLKPSKIVWIHWEDFFRKPLDFDGARLVRFTRFGVLNRKLKKAGYEPSQQTQVMPRPGTKIIIN